MKPDQLRVANALYQRVKQIELMRLSRDLSVRCSGDEAIEVMSAGARERIRAKVDFELLRAQDDCCRQLEAMGVETRELRIEPPIETADHVGEADARERPYMQLVRNLAIHDLDQSEDELASLFRLFVQAARELAQGRHQP